MTRSQLSALAAEYPGCLLLFHGGDSFTAYGEDAQLLDKLLPETIDMDTIETPGLQSVAFNCFDLHRVVSCILEKNGRRVTILEQN